MEGTEDTTLDAVMRLSTMLLDLCHAISNGTTVRVAVCEMDDHEEDDVNNGTFLKLNGKRCGRDFGVYELMGPAGGLADFAAVICAVRTVDIEAYNKAVPMLLAWAKHFPPSMQAEWKALWT